MRLKNRLILLVTAVFFGGCAYNNQPTVFENMNKFNLHQNFKQSLNSEEEINIEKKEKENKPKTLSSPPIVQPVNINSKYSIKIEKANETNKNIALNVENIPLSDFIKLVFGQILKYNYSISQDVEKSKKTVTLKMSEKVSQKEFFNIVQKIINSYNFVIKKENDIYYIKRGRAKKVQKLSEYFFYGRDLPKNLSDNLTITMIIPSYYIDFANVEWIIKRFYLSPNAYVINLRAKHVLIVTDQVSYIRKALAFINIMDIPTLKSKITSIVELEYIDAGDFLTRLKELLPSTGIPVANRLNDLGVLLKSIPELNSLLVVSEKREWLDAIRYWKERLDIIDVNSEKPQIFIYKPQNRSAKDLEKLIKELFSKIVTTEDKNGKKLKKSSKYITKNELKVMYDDGRNSLIVYTTPSKYKQIHKMLKKLDTLPKQVLVQVTIAEITLKDSLQYGFEWFLQHNGSSTFSLGTLGNLGIGGGGLVGSVINADQTFQAILNTLAQKNLINILSSPKLIVLDNHTANINVGTQVPVLTSSTTAQNTATTTTQVTQSVQYRNTGIILNVKPIIHSNGTLTLDISQTVSDPQPNNTSNISSPIILNRSLKTNVILKSNQALLLGGLIKENSGRTDNKVPFLGDMPLVGSLFKTRSFSKEKTELIVIVKPIILSNTNESQEITEKFKQLIINSTKEDF